MNGATCPVDASGARKCNCPLDANGLVQYTGQLCEIRSNTYVSHNILSENSVWWNWIKSFSKLFILACVSSWQCCMRYEKCRSGAEGWKHGIHIDCDIKKGENRYKEMCSRWYFFPISITISFYTNWWLFDWNYFLLEIGVSDTKDTWLSLMYKILVGCRN